MVCLHGLVEAILDGVEGSLGNGLADQEEGLLFWSWSHERSSVAFRLLLRGWLCFQGFEKDLRRL